MYTLAVSGAPASHVFALFHLSRQANESLREQLQLTVRLPNEYNEVSVVRIPKSPDRTVNVAGVTSIFNPKMSRMSYRGQPTDNILSVVLAFEARGRNEIK